MADIERLRAQLPRRLHAVMDTVDSRAENGAEQTVEDIVVARSLSQQSVSTRQVSSATRRSQKPITA